MSDPNYRKIFDRALKLLGRQPRSVAQLRARLLEKSKAEEAVEQAIARLIELGYLNDEEFAYNYASSKLSIKAVGRERLRRMLAQKLVAPETAEKALSRLFAEQDEEKLCERALAKHLRIHGKPTDVKQSRKLLAYLIRLGFPYNLAIKKVRSSAPLEDLADETEY